MKELFEKIQSAKNYYYAVFFKSIFLTWGLIFYPVKAFVSRKTTLSCPIISTMSFHTNATEKIFSNFKMISYFKLYT